MESHIIFNTYNFELFTIFTKMLGNMMRKLIKSLFLINNINNHSFLVKYSKYLQKKCKFSHTFTSQFALTLHSQFSPRKSDTIYDFIVEVTYIARSQQKLHNETLTVLPNQRLNQNCHQQSPSEICDLKRRVFVYLGEPI